MLNAQFNAPIFQMARVYEKSRKITKKHPESETYEKIRAWKILCWFFSTKPGFASAVT